MNGANRRRDLGRMVVVTMAIILLAPALADAEKPRIRKHVIDEPSWLTSAHQVNFADIDQDGDMDWIVGNVHREPNLYWYEYQRPEKWVAHFIGSAEVFYGGACVLDANKDSWPDIVSAELLFINPKNPRDAEAWKSYNIGTADDKVHDMQAFDINGDGQLDILANCDSQVGLCWYEAPADPIREWTRHEIGGGYRVHGCTFPEAVGDLDGDGDYDVAAATAWFENVSPNGEGLSWKKNPYSQKIGKTGPWGVAVRTVVRDIDFDGDMDIVQAECDLKEPDTAGIGWLENSGGGSFTLHWIQPRVPGDYHTLAVIDYDNDGDWDVYTGIGPLGVGRRTLLYENLAGTKGKPRRVDDWQQHTIYSGHCCHEGVASDVDKDGDIDFVTKPWDTRDIGPFVYLENQTGKDALGFREWQYLQLDDQRGKWGDDHEPEYMKYVGLAMEDVTGDGQKDIISGRYIYSNPGGNLTGKWRRIELKENVDAILFYNVDDDAYPDIIAQSYPDVFWLEAVDAGGQEWSMTKIGDAPKTPHGNGQGHAFADIVAGGKKELVLSTGEGLYYWIIPANPSELWERVHISSKADEQGLACGDLDGDSDIDVVAALKEDHLTVVWFENPGNRQGKWADHIVGAVANEGKGAWWGADRLAIADLDGDGRNEVVVTEEDPADKGTTGNLWWFKPRKDPKKRWAKIHLLDAYTLNNLDLADMDGDGDVDILTQEHKGLERLFVLENRTRGGQWIIHVIDSGKEGHNGAKAADLDGDGDKEIVSMAWDDYQYLHLWRNDNR